MPQRAAERSGVVGAGLETRASESEDPAYIDMTARHRYVEPKDARAEPVCLLDKAWAARRAEPPDAFMASARSQASTESGSELRFEAAPGMWERVETFIDEERECCPFFAFEVWEEDGEVVLRILQPEGASRG